MERERQWLSVTGKSYGANTRQGAWPRITDSRIAGVWEVFTSWCAGKGLARQHQSKSAVRPDLATDLRDIVERLKPNKPIDVRDGALLTVGISALDALYCPPPLRTREHTRTRQCNKR